MIHGLIVVDVLVVVIVIVGVCALVRIRARVGDRIGIRCDIHIDVAGFVLLSQRIHEVDLVAGRRRVGGGRWGARAMAGRVWDGRGRIAELMGLCLLALWCLPLGGRVPLRQTLEVLRLMLMLLLLKVLRDRGGIWVRSGVLRWGLVGRRLVCERLLLLLRRKGRVCTAVSDAGQDAGPQPRHDVQFMAPSA